MVRLDYICTKKIVPFNKVSSKVWRFLMSIFSRKLCLQCPVINPVTALVCFWFKFRISAIRFCEGAVLHDLLSPYPKQLVYLFKQASIHQDICCITYRLWARKCSWGLQRFPTCLLSWISRSFFQRPSFNTLSSKTI